MNKFRIAIKLLFSICVSLNISVGQHLEDSYTIRNFNDENGLPQNSVKSISVGNLGFVWLSTESGLARFDGQRVMDLTTMLKGHPGTFHYVVPDISGNADKLYGVRLHQPAIRIHNGVATIDRSYQYDAFMAKLPYAEGEGMFMHTELPGMVGDNNFAKDVHTSFLIIPGHEGRYYKFSRSAISLFDKWKLQWEIPHSFPTFRNFFTIGDQLLYLHPDGYLLQFRDKHWAPVTITGDIAGDRHLKSTRPKLFWSVINQQSFVLLGDRFYRISPAKDGRWNSELLLDGFSFENENIRSAYYDTGSQSLLLGSVTKGLFVIKKHCFAGVVYGRSNMENVFYSQTVLDSNRLLLPGGKILGIKRKGTKLETLRSTTRAPRVIDPNETRYSIRDKRGRVWMSAGDSLLAYTADGNKLLAGFSIKREMSRIFAGSRKTLSHELVRNGKRVARTDFSGTNITCIFESPYGEMIVGCRGLGLFAVSETTHKFVPYYTRPEMGNVVTVLSSDADHLWLGTDHGLFLFDLKTRTPRMIPGTAGLFIRSMHTRANEIGTLFFTALERGIFYYDGVRVTQFPIDPKRYLSMAHCLFEDQLGYFWITTNRGLFQVKIDDCYEYLARKRRHKPASLFYLYYTKEEGFHTNEFNGGCQPCAVRLPNGFTSLPSLNGLVFFEPERIVPNLPDRPLAVDRVEVQTEMQQVLGDTVRLNLNPRNISFHLSTPYFGHSNNLHFSYALMHENALPESGDWMPVLGADPVVRFSELASGHYTLWIRKPNGFGLDNHRTRKIQILVPLNWYETLWFKLLLIVLLAGLIYLIFALRTRGLNRRNQQLAKHVAERTRSLQETLSTLQTSEQELTRQMQFQKRLVASISHDVRTPLNYSASASELVAQMIDGGQYSEASTLSMNIGASTRQIYTQIDNLVTFSKTQIHGLQTKGKQVRIRHLVEEKLQIFQSILAHRQVSFHNDLPANLKVTTSPQLLGIVLHNLIDNGLKHAYRGGTVRVKSEKLAGGTHVIFADTGPGLAKDIVAWLNEPTELGKLPKEYRGLGLLIVKETAKILDIKIFAENRHGACIHLIFPSEEREL